MARAEGMGRRYYNEGLGFFCPPVYEKHGLQVLVTISELTG